MSIKIKCECCAEYSTREEWNKATIKDFGKFADIYFVELFKDKWEDCQFVCPKCGSVHYGICLLVDDENE